MMLPVAAQSEVVIVSLPISVLRHIRFNAFPSQQILVRQTSLSVQAAPQNVLIGVVNPLAPVLELDALGQFSLPDFLPSVTTLGPAIRKSAVLAPADNSFAVLVDLRMESCPIVDDDRFLND